MLGHGQNEDAAADDDGEMVSSRPRRHILVTGGFGSLGKFVVRDMLLGLSSPSTTAKSDLDDWAADDASKEEDILVTILDVKDRTAELNFLLQSAPLEKGPKIKGTDPRAQAFTSSERSVDNFKRAGKLRVLVGDVRDKELMASVLVAGGTTMTEMGGNQAAAAALNAKLGRPKLGKGSHQTTTTFIPPVSGIIHLASYSPAACRLNPADCESVETEGMTAMLDVLERKGLEKTGKDGKTQIVDRPWVVVPRRADNWEEVRLLAGRNAKAER